VGRIESGFGFGGVDTCLLMERRIMRSFRSGVCVVTVADLWSGVVWTYRYPIAVIGWQG
jgi:hypothetical protein